MSAIDSYFEKEAKAMTFLTRFEPSSDIRTLQSRFFEPFFRLNVLDDERGNGTWVPPMDIAEENDRLLIRVEVPGVEEKDLKVNFEDGLLMISGERQFERKDDRNYHRIERSYGSFSRSFTLPRNVDSNKISATYKNGMLEIEVPKLEEAKPKQIQIKA